MIYQRTWDEKFRTSGYPVPPREMDDLVFERARKLEKQQALGASNTATGAPGAGTIYTSARVPA